MFPFYYSHLLFQPIHLSSLSHPILFSIHYIPSSSTNLFFISLLHPSFLFPFFNSLCFLSLKIFFFLILGFSIWKEFGETVKHSGLDTTYNNTHTALHCTALHCTALLLQPNTMPYCTAPIQSKLRHITLYCTRLHLFWNPN
jgi:hypothetical protein